MLSSVALISVTYLISRSTHFFNKSELKRISFSVNLSQIAMSYSIEQRDPTAIWFEEFKFKSIALFEKDWPKSEKARMSQMGLILRWQENAFKFGNVLHRHEDSGRPRAARSLKNNEATFNASPRKSIRRANSEIDEIVTPPYEEF